jgi:hypothetical protein
MTIFYLARYLNSLTIAFMNVDFLVRFDQQGYFASRSISNEISLRIVFFAICLGHLIILITTFLELLIQEKKYS